MCLALGSCTGFYQNVDPSSKACDILGRIANQVLPMKYTYTNTKTNNYYYKGQTTETIKVEKNTYKEIVDFDNRNYYTYSLIDTGDQIMKIETWGLTKGCSNFFAINIDDKEKTFRNLTSDEFETQIQTLKNSFKERFDPVAFLKYMQLFNKEEYLVQSREGLSENDDLEVGTNFYSKGKNSLRSLLYKSINKKEGDNNISIYEEQSTETNNYWIINHSQKETKRVSSPSENYKTVIKEEKAVKLNTANIPQINLDEYRYIP